MNNKGQSLVMFIILLPIIIIVLGIVIDIGSMGLEKIKVQNTLKDAISYGLNNDSNKNEIEELINKNITYDQIDIKKDDDISITIEYKSKSIFNLVNNKIKYQIKGYKKNKKIILKEE